MKKMIKDYLNQYTHSTPIIHSHLEDQFDYELYFNQKNDFGILFTSFDYHYTFGKMPEKAEIIKVIKDYVNKHNKTEFILFGPDESWDSLLTSVTNELNGVIDKRVLYHLNREKFLEYDVQNEFIKLEVADETHSKIPYVQASAYIEGKLISFCRALMTGKKEVELDVWTDKTERQKGYGFDTSLTLIKYLLDNGLSPNWSCWEHKEISNILAKKLEFELVKTFNAYIYIPKK